MISDELLPLRSDASSVEHLYPAKPVSKRSHVLKAQILGRIIDYFPFLFLFGLLGVLWDLRPFEDMSIYFKIGGSVIILAVFIWWIYIVFIKPHRFQINSKHIKVDSLKNQVKIAMMTDLHTGEKRYGASVKKIKKAIDVINNYKPDIFVISGDLVDEDFNDLSRETLLELKKINCKNKFAVYGNHDGFHMRNRGYKESPKALIKFIEKETGIKFLGNRAKEIEIKNNNIFIGGVPDLSGRLINIDKTFEGVDKDSVDYTILISHNPDIIDFLHESDEVDLVLAGHNHAGQIAFPIVGSLLPLPSKHRHYLKGEYEVGGNTKLFLSQGFAHASTRVRVGTNTEINLITLTK
ncbi:MAG: metallophosphoesterase [bacterium]